MVYILSQLRYTIGIERKYNMYHTEEALLRKEKELFEKRVTLLSLIIPCILAIVVISIPLRAFALGMLAVLVVVYLIDLDHFIALRSKYLRLYQD